MNNRYEILKLDKKIGRESSGFELLVKDLIANVEFGFLLDKSPEFNYESLENFFKTFQKGTIDEYKLCYSLCHKDGNFLDYVPLKHRTSELCAVAVKANPNALKFVPKDIMSEEIATISIERNGRNLMYVPIEKRNLNLCNLAMINYPKAIRYVPEDKLTFNMCMFVAKQNLNTLLWIPDKFLSKIYNACMYKNPEKFKELDYNVFEKINYRVNSFALNELLSTNQNKNSNEFNNLLTNIVITQNIFLSKLRDEVNFLKSKANNDSFGTGRRR